MREKKVIKINRFDNFNDTSSIKTKMFYNYSPTNELKNSLGIRNALFPKNSTNTTEKKLNIADVGVTSVEGIGYFKQYFESSQHTTHRLLIYGNDKKVYINQLLDDTYDLFWLYNLEFETAPLVLTYKKDDVDSAILVSDDLMKVWTTGYSPYTVTDIPVITSMCMNEEILFCTIKSPAFKVWYATDLTAENVGKISSTSGYISLEDDLGDAKKVVTFNENVYVFRDYGITKINKIKGSNIVSQIYQSNTKIFANTVCVCGNCILFMTNEGLYSFNGLKVSKTDVTLLNDMPIVNDGAVAETLGDKYYLALKLDFEDEKEILSEPDGVNNVLLIVNTTDFSYEIIRGVDIKTMLPLKLKEFEKMLVLFNTGEVGKIGEIVSTPKCIDDNLPKYWLSENLTDSMNVKLFTKLKVCADEQVKFKLKYDDNEIDFTTFKTGINEFSFKIMCKQIQLEISTEQESGAVQNVELEYYEY